MSQNSDSFKRVLAYAQNNFGIKIKYKNESKLMKFLGLFLFFNNKFMTNYTTVVGKTVYFPDEAWVDRNRERAARVLCHELVHITDEDRIGAFTFRMTYLFPQWLSVFSLFAFLVGPVALIFLLFLAPLPAPFRAFWEMRGYAMTDAVHYRATGKFANISWLTSQFTTNKYYFMWPFEKSLIAEIKSNRQMIKYDYLSEKIYNSNKILDAFQPRDKK